MMCGRLNVTDDPLVIGLGEALGIKLSVTTNHDLRPTQELAAIVPQGQLNCRWGIKPEWSDKLLINAQAEKMTSSRLWRPAFQHQRCLVPCTGWYEWRTEEDNRKHKYLFTGSDHKPLLMAGLYWPAGVYDEQPTVVTLTTTPNQYAAQYHHRMPVIIPLDNADWWLNGRSEGLAPLLMPLPEKSIVATSA
ncbi:SOS response-associated peptidase [Rheinheimera aquimaris]|uniref:SOS response-associated peptidase n=1 Tax=Rheinheimera aquimaris TaxID=412437 RepID=UPI003A96A258